MSFFDEDDPFEDIVREFFGSSPVRRLKRDQFIRGEDEDRVIDFVEEDEEVFLIFELPGYDEEDISVNVKNRNLEVIAKKSNGDAIQDYLDQKLRQGVIIQKKLPEIVNVNKMKHYVNNGVLEIVFEKQRGIKNESRKIKIN